MDLGVRWIPFSSKFNEAIVQQKQSESFFFRVLAFSNFRARVFHIGARNTDSIKKKIFRPILNSDLAGVKGV